MNAIVLGPGGLDVDDVVAVADGAILSVDPAVRVAMTRARNVAVGVAAEGGAVYGVNRGLGHDRDRFVAAAPDAAAREIEMWRAHAAGIGEPLPARVVRATVAATAGILGRAGTAARPELVDALCASLAGTAPPAIPEVASVGEADLMAMGALGLAIAGDGTSGSKAGAGFAPAAHEGLALLGTNGLATGLACLVATQADAVMRAADIAGMLTWHVIVGSTDPFSVPVAQAHGDPHVIAAARRLRRFARGATHTPTTLQDPLSVRTMAIINGAMDHHVAEVRAAARICLRGRHGNPLITADAVRPSGNFAPLRLALAAEGLRVAATHVALAAERRLAKVAEFGFGLSGPPVDTPGGLAAAGTLAYSAAAVVARMRAGAGPLSVHCPPLDRDVEDHATLAPATLQATAAALDDLLTVLACETVLAADALAGRDMATIATRIRPHVTSVRGILGGAGPNSVAAAVAATARHLVKS